MGFVRLTDFIMTGRESLATESGKLFHLFLLVFMLVANSLVADTPPIDWPLLAFTQVTTNVFTSPIGIAHAGDGTGRLFVVQKHGQVLIVQNGNVMSQPFLDISNRVLSIGAEQGLLGLAFPPGFSTNNHFYVDYTRQPDGAIVISRFFLTSTNSNVADTNSEQIVKVIPKPNPSTTYNNHNAGQLAFGPDGYLYVGVGDGGSEGDPLNNGQNTTNLFGKILRIDVENGVSPYAIPASNPFVNSNNFAPETWAYGLRNPWRFSFDRQTGDLYIGDVGQYKFEEIDFQAAGSSGGQNYGWRIMEANSNYIVPVGFTNFAALTPPVTFYSHFSLPTDGSGAVIGGYVYRGPSLPRMNGMYFYGDFMAGWIWGMKQTGTNWQTLALIAPGLASSTTNISTFGEDDQGNLYLADYYHGKILQLADSGQVWTPTFSPTGGTVFSNIVVVSCLTPNAEIHYTTNSVDPTLSDPIVISGTTIQVATGITNKLRAFRSDLTPSAVALAIFTDKVATPFFTPGSGVVIGGTLVTISTITPGAIIYFTTNGTTPTINSAIYSGSIAIQANTTIEAFGVEPGYSNSAVISGSFSLPQTATPSFNPPAGAITNGTTVAISSTTPGAVIHYTLDGSTPTDSSPVCNGSLVMNLSNGGVTVHALASANGYLDSSVASAFYGLFSPDSTVVTTLAGGSAAGYTNGFGGLAMFSNPQGICIDNAGNLYVGDSGNNVVRKISTSGLVTTFAGNGQAGSNVGPATNAEFAGPTGVCVDTAGNFYVADGANCNRVCKIDTNGTVSVLADIYGDCLHGVGLWQLVADPSGNVYVGSLASVQEILPEGIVIVLAGPNACCPDGWGINVGPGIDAADNIYAATGNLIWKILPDGTTSLFTGGTTGFSDGPLNSALFQSPQDCFVDASTNILIADVLRIRKAGFNGWVSTLAGSGTSGYRDGRGSVAKFANVTSLCADTNGNIYVTDSANNCIRKISPDTYGIGIPDWWQLAHFGYVGIDPNADPDHDGMSNYQEFWAGTDPNDPNSVFKIVNASVNESGTQISWSSVLGKNYIVQYSTNLVSWTTLGSQISGTGSVVLFTDPTPPQSGTRFYRVSIANL